MACPVCEEESASSQVCESCQVYFTNSLEEDVSVDTSSDAEESDGDCEVQQVRTFNEALDSRFKEAEENGEVVMISSHDEEDSDSDDENGADDEDSEVQSDDSDDDDDDEVQILDPPRRQNERIHNMVQLWLEQYEQQLEQQLEEQHRQYAEQLRQGIFRLRNSRRN